MKFRTIASMAIMAVGLATTTTLSAQTPTTGSSPRSGGRMAAMALQGITLSPSQQAQVDSITAKTRAQMPPMTPGTPPSDADRQKMMSLSTASLKEVRTVLTPEQQKIFDKNVAGIQQQMQQGMPGMPSGAVPQGAAPTGASPKP